MKTINTLILILATVPCFASKPSMESGSAASVDLATAFATLSVTHVAPAHLKANAELASEIQVQGATQNGAPAYLTSVQQTQNAAFAFHVAQQQTAAMKARASNRDDFELEFLAGSDNAFVKSYFKEKILPQYSLLDPRDQRQMWRGFKSMVSEKRAEIKKKEELKKQGFEARASKQLTIAPSSQGKILIFDRSVVSTNPKVKVIEPELSFLWGIPAECMKISKAWIYQNDKWTPLKYQNNQWLPVVVAAHNQSQSNSAAAKK